MKLSFPIMKLFLYMITLANGNSLIVLVAANDDAQATRLVDGQFPTGKHKGPFGCWKDVTIHGEPRIMTCV